MADRNTWQQLGDMNREVAMEQYITLLSRSIPGWMGDDTKGDGKQIFSDGRSYTNLPSNLHKQTGTKNESLPEELKPCCDEERRMISVELSNITNKVMVVAAVRQCAGGGEVRGLVIVWVKAVAMGFGRGGKT
ncbi:hypothetical protein CsSME_00005587 [Camellia sinensis var. sinensis]